MQSIERIHDTAVHILEQIGIRLHHPHVVEVARQNGCRVVGKTVFFSDGQIQKWIAKAPRSFTLHARNPRHDMRIGADRVECTAGYGAASIIEADGVRRDALLEDYICFAKLVHQSDHFRINGGILAQPWDVQAHLSHLVMLYTAITYSDKCLMGIPGNSTEMEDIMQIGALCFGGVQGLREKPRILTLISTLSPLQIDSTALESILMAAHYRQPLILSSAPGAGSTGPISLAGNLALGTAETLAAVVLTQMIEPGLPVIFGIQAYGCDLKSGNISIGSPALALQARYNALLARMYGLPSRGGGACNDAKSVSVQSGYESMLSLLASLENRLNLVVHAAGILDCFAAMSYEQFLVDLEMIDMVKYYLGGLTLPTDGDLSLEVIREVGAGGNFLTADDTVEKCRTHSWNPDIGLRGWLSVKSPEERLSANIQAKKNRMLTDYHRPELEAAIQQRIRKFLRRKGVDRHTLDAIEGKPASPP